MTTDKKLPKKVKDINYLLSDDLINYIILFIASVLLAFFMLMPILNSGFISDDAVNSFVKGTILYNNITLPDYILQNIDFWLENGRFLPLLFTYMYTFFYLITDVFQYKLLILLSVILNIFLFYLLVKLMTGSKWLSILAISLIPLFFQLRYYHDPILSFQLQMQLVFLFTTASLIFIYTCLKNKDDRYLILSLFFYLLELLTYEVTDLFFVLNLIIIYFYAKCRNVNYLLKMSVGFVFLSFLFILIPIVLRIYLGIPLTGSSYFDHTPHTTYIPNLNPIAFITTLMKQITAALPLSFYVSEYLQNPTLNYGGFKNLFYPNTIIIAFAYIFIYLSISKKIVNELSENANQSINITHLSIFGLALMILPGIMLSLSPKYQDELVWGTGYIPVYVSYFGAAILAICAIYEIYRKFYNHGQKNAFKASLIIALILSVTGVVTYNSNLNVVETSNNYSLYPRTIIEDSLNVGLFKTVPNGSTLWVESNYPWDDPSFYMMHSNVRLNQIVTRNNHNINTAQLFASLSNDSLAGIFSNNSYYRSLERNNLYYLYYTSQSKNKGYAIMGKIEDLEMTNSIIYNVTARDAYVYVHSDSINSHNLSVLGRWRLMNNSSYRPFELNDNQVNLKYSGKEWLLFSLGGKDTVIDMKSLYIKLDSENTMPLVVPTIGWHNLENWNGVPTRWIENDAILNIICNNSGNYKLSMVISSFYKNNTMEIYANDNLVDEFTVGPKSFTAIYILIYLERGTNFIKLHAVRECEKPSDMSELKNGDNRCLSFAIQNIALEGETKQYGPQENARQNSSPVVAFGSGFYMPENWSGILTRWMQANAIILVNSSEDSTANLNLQSLSFYRNRTLEISSDGAPAAQVAVPTSLINVSVPISLDKGVNTVRLHVTEGCERPSDKPELSNPDSRCLSVAVQNLTVT